MTFLNKKHDYLTQIKSIYNKNYLILKDNSIMLVFKIENIVSLLLGRLTYILFLRIKK